MTIVLLEKSTIEELDAVPTVSIDVQAGLTCRWCGRPILPYYSGSGFDNVWAHVRPKYPRAGPRYCGQYRKMAEPIIELNPFDYWG